MKEFKFNENVKAVCEYKPTRNGFLHKATLYENAKIIGTAQISYINRTWECFEYETVLYKLIEKFYENEELEELRNILKLRAFI